MTLWLAAITGAMAVALALPTSGSAPLRSPAPAPATNLAAADTSWLLRHRGLCSLLAGVGAWVFVGGPAGVGLGIGGCAVAWVAIGRAEPPAQRRRREEIARDLPAVVLLFGAALRSGTAPVEALRLVVQALPGAAADRMAPLVAHLDLGARPAEVWADLAHDRDLAALGRTMARASATGAPVVAAVQRLADDLALRARSDVEDRARAVGVQAAVPLGLCLLPAFVLIGIVPLVAALLESLAW
ncbi:MAG: type II secretion system F family protein [Nocardioides sp.]